MYDTILMSLILIMFLWGSFTRPDKWAWLTRILGAIFFAIMFIATNLTP